MLVKTIEEVRAVCKVPLALKYQSLDQDIEEAEIKYLVPAIGNELYEALESAYQGNTLDEQDKAPLKAILLHCQRIICNMAVAEAIDYLQVQVTENGVQRIEKADEKAAYQYQKLEAQDYYARKGYNSVERLLLALEKAPANYPSWKTSSAYTRRREMFIPDAGTFHQYYQIDESRRTYVALLPFMKRVEEFKIRETIGQALFDKLKAELIHPVNNVSPDSLLLITGYIQPAVAHLTMGIACHELAMKVTPVGVVVSDSLAIAPATQEKKAPASDKLDLLSSRSNGTGENYLSRLKNFLIVEATAEKYPEFFSSPLYPKPAAAEEKPQSKIYGAL